MYLGNPENQGSDFLPFPKDDSTGLKEIRRDKAEEDQAYKIKFEGWSAKALELSLHFVVKRKIASLFQSSEVTITDFRVDCRKLAETIQMLNKAKIN